MENSNTDYYALAIQAAGVCAPGEENTYFARVRSLAVRMGKEALEMNTLLNDINRCEIGGGEANGNKGFGKFTAVINRVDLRKDQANRAYIYYTDSNGNTKTQDGKDLFIVTEPTNSVPSAAGIYALAQELVGHEVVMYKRPDPDFDRAKVGLNSNPRKTLFHLIDNGSASKQGNHGSGASRPQTQPQGQVPPVDANNQQGQNNQQARSANANPSGEQRAKEAKNALFQSVKNSFGTAPQQVIIDACAQGWQSIGSPTIAPTQQQYNQALQAAHQYVQQSANSQ